MAPSRIAAPAIAGRRSCAGGRRASSRPPRSAACRSSRSTRRTSLDGFDPDADLGYPGPVSRSRAASTPACTAAGCGPCGSSPASARRGRPTSGSSSCSSKGQTGLSTAFDLPTLMGLDSDDPRSLGEVGRLGVAVDTLDDMRAAVRRHRPRQGLGVDDHQRPGHRRHGLLPGQRPGPAASTGSKLRGTIQNDILKEFHAQNEFVFPPEPSRAAGDAT